MAVVRVHRARGAAASVVRSALAALLVVTTSIGGPAQPRTADAGVAPTCSYGDTLTHYHARSDWYRSLLDTRYRLASTYAPADLVSARRSGASGPGSVRRIVLADLTAMYRAARAAGATFAIQSAYRSYSQQVSTFNRWVLEDGYASAIQGSARPGHSEHQLGTAMDLKTPGGPQPWDVTDWGTTKAGAWIARNSWRYGWLISYPKGKSPSASCYRYEPWHVRYFGRVIAAKIHRSTLTPREWLYVKGATTTWIGGGTNPTPTPTPTPSADPADAPSALPTDEPTATPSAAPMPSDEPPVEPATP